MKKTLIICFALGSILLFSCKKDVEELPPATQTGAHTFGTKVNGEMWMPAQFGPFPGNILEGHWAAGNGLYINARNLASSPNETEFEIYLNGVTGPGVYPLNTTLIGPTTAANYAYYVKRNISPQNEWMTSAQYSGSVNLTRVDTVAGIVSGTFQFSMINLYNAPEPLTVTEGRFDIRTN